MPRSYPTTPMCDGELLALFEPTTRDSDVFVTTTAKCGQTWLQTILFHLKTGGHKPDFGGVGLGGVSPWLEIPQDFGYGRSWDTREERLAGFEALDDPRVFKMHVAWDEVPRPAGSKAKIITITRDPRDVPYSMFSHMLAMKPREGRPQEDNFDRYFEGWMERGLYFSMVASYWEHVGEPDFLWLRYEDMQRDLRGQIDRLVSFLGWPVTLEDIDRTLPLVDFQHLRAIEKTQLMPHADAAWKDDGNFFREGGMGKNRARLSAEQQRRIVDRLHAELPPDCCQFVLSLEE